MSYLSLEANRADYPLDDFPKVDKPGILNKFDDDFRVLLRYDSNSATKDFVTKLTKSLRKIKLFSFSTINWLLIPLIDFLQVATFDMASHFVIKKIAFSRLDSDLAIPRLALTGII